MKSLVFALLPVLAVAACGSDDAKTGGTAPEGQGPASPAGNEPPVQNTPGNNQPGTEPPAPAVPTELFGFVGSNDGYLRTYRVDPVTGAWTPGTETKVGTNPWFAAFDPSHHRVVAIDELTATVHSYTFDAKTAALTEVNSKPTGGEGPVHVAIDPSKKWVTVANYGGGNVTIRPIADDGTLGDPTDDKPSGAGSHWAAMDPLGHDVFVAAVDRNAIAQYRFDDKAGKLIENGWGDPPPGAGPRHVAVHPNLKWCYAINRNHTNVSAYFFDPNFAGKMWPINNTSALPGGQESDTDEISGAEIFIHPNGKWVYASTRGYNSIASFTIDPSSGELTLVGNVETGASQPRSFGLDPEGTLIFAGNQDADHVVGFKIDATTGALTSIGKVLDVTKPTFVGLARFN